MNFSQKIGIGTVQFGLDYGISNQDGKTSFEEAKEIIFLAKKKNIQVIDTAFAYGESEAVLGDIGIKEFNVVTKFKASEPVHILEQFNTSLLRLRQRSVYGLLSHNVSDIVLNKSNWQTLLELKEKKVVKKIGFSFNKEAEIEQVLKVNIIPDIIQIPFNILDQRFISIANYFKKKGAEIHSRSSFLQGLFFCKPDKLGNHFTPIKPFIGELQKKSKQLAPFLLQYCLQNEVIDKTIIGLNTSYQFLELFNNLNQDMNISFSIPSVDETILCPSNWNL